MAHHIYNEKFISYRQPAWHELGLVVDEQMNATEAAEKIKIPTISTEPVVTTSGLVTDCKAIVGQTDEGRTVYSVVSKGYYEIRHCEFVAAWDKSVKQHIETIGVLMGGAGLFISAKLPSFTVKGEEINAYVLAENWLTGMRSSKVRKTPVRVVCMNTLQMSDAKSVQEIRIHHAKPTMEQLEKALEGIIEQSIGEYRAIKELFEILSSSKVTDEEAGKVFEAAYPKKELPKHLLSRAASDDSVLDALAKAEQVNGRQVKHQNECLRLFGGEGVGCMSDAAKGTLWGAYNAVAEYEQYCKAKRNAESTAFGMGRSRVVSAFEQACVMAGVN